MFRETSNRADQLSSNTRSGGSYVSEVQYARICNAAVALVAEMGYARMSVDRVSRHAGVSRRTFYECFTDFEECFLSVFDQAVGRMATVMSTAYEREVSWTAKIRAALLALLELLEHEPDVSTVVFVESLAAGPKVREHRVTLLEKVRCIFEERSYQAKTIDGAELSERSPLTTGGEVDQEASEHSPLTTEGAVNAVWGILHTRIVQQSSPAHLPAARYSLIELVNPLTAMIALPYIGHVAAAMELSRPAPQCSRSSAATSMNGAGPHRVSSASTTASDLDGLPEPTRSPLEGLPMRVTYRTLRVLTAIAEHGEQGHNPSNREIADAAEIADQAQISRLLRRLQELRLIEKLDRGDTQGKPNAWRLTAWGKEVQRELEASSDG
jgi:AcrR family transcriptional regulator/DNA-binding MarR family transcriptional regulator